MRHARAGLAAVAAVVLTISAAAAGAATAGPAGSGPVAAGAATGGPALTAADGERQAYTEWRSQLVRESVLEIAQTAPAAIGDSAGLGSEDSTPSAPTASTRFAARRLWLAPSTPDPWRGLDKKLHIAASYGAFLTFRLAEDTSTQAALSAFAVGVLKEAHDVWLRKPGPSQGASWRDLVADAAGVAAGALAWSVLAP